MSRSLNKVMLIGNLGNDPEVRSTSGGNRVATFSLATSRSWNDAAGAKQEKTEWHRCVVWNTKSSQLADIVERGIEQCRPDALATHLRCDRQVRDLSLAGREPRDNITEHARRGRTGHCILAHAREVHPTVGENVSEGALGPWVREGAAFDRRNRGDVRLPHRLHALHHDGVLPSGSNLP